MALLGFLKPSEYVWERKLRHATVRLDRDLKFGKDLGEFMSSSPDLDDCQSCQCQGQQLHGRCALAEGRLLKMAQEAIAT